MININKKQINGVFTLKIALIILSVNLTVCSPPNNIKNQSSNVSLLKCDCSPYCNNTLMVIGSDTIISKYSDSSKRYLDNFKKITPIMTLPEIIDLVGPADCDCGSGLYILNYSLQDSSCITIGTSGQYVLYVKHNGRDLIKMH